MKKYFYFLAITVLFAACQPNNDLGTPFQKGQKVTLSATIANSDNGAKQLPGKQRVAGQDVSTEVKLTWNTGDQIKVTVNGQSATFTLIGEGDSNTGEFEGTMPADGTNYTVTYPVDAVDLTTTTQTYVPNGFGDELMAMSGTGTLEDGFILSAQNALLGLQLRGSKRLSDIVVTNRKTGDKYTLDCSGAILENAPKLFYIVVPAGEWKNGFKVEVLEDDESLIADFEKKSSATFTANQAMVMPPKVADYDLKTLTFEDEDSQFGEYTLNIDGDWSGGSPYSIYTWNDLIPQDMQGFGAPMIYGGDQYWEFYFDDWNDDPTASTYFWYDQNNTELMHILPGDYMFGGMAISKYAEQQGYIQDYSKQLTAYATSGNNGSSNFCMVHAGMGDGVFTSYAFADEVARVIDHMYVANCVLTNGQLYNSSEELKIRAVGIAEDDSETELEFTLVENGTAIEDWKEWKLTKLGKVKQVNFYVEGGDSFDMMMGGIPQPSFAFDDIAVRFPKQ